VEGRIVLITGGAIRVGAAICRRLHAEGANLMLHYRASAGEARLLQAELNHIRSESVALIQADLLDLNKLPAMVDQTLQTFGRLDALVNNASSFFPTPVGDITAQAWDDLVGTNLARRCFSRRLPRRR
jgi:pteridine reductase